MKNIKDIMDEMDKLCEEENNKLHSAIDYCANGIDPCNCEEDNLCSEVPFCCVITVPQDFTFSGLDTDINVGVVDKCCTVTAGDVCCQEVCGCRIKLQKFSVNACLDVRVSIKVTDPSGNETHLCCCDCVCFEGEGICCSPVPCDCSNLNFSILDKYASKLADACDATPAPSTKEIWQITGNIGFSCNPDCPLQ